MKKIIIAVLISISLFSTAETGRQIEAIPFRSGEVLTFRIAFNSVLTGNLTAGKASLKVLQEKELIRDNSCYHVVMQGGTTGFVEHFYKIDEKFDSYINDKSILPLLFKRRTRENRYKKDDIVYFNHNNQTAKSIKKKTTITANTHDIISAFYFARMQDFSKMKVGESFSIPYYFDDTIAVTKIVYFGKQNIKTGMGTFSCLVLKPLVATGRVFSQQYPVTFWVTNDKNRIPVLIESKLVVGKARIELVAYSEGDESIAQIVDQN